MSTLYEIDKSILECFDEESGEVLDAERLDALMMERETKIESVVLWVKNLLSDADAFKVEKEAFAARERAARNKADRLKEWLKAATECKKFSTTRVQLNFRKSEALEVADEDAFICWAIANERDDLLTFAKPTVNKPAIKRSIGAGETFDGVEIVEKQNLQIK